MCVSSETQNVYEDIDGIGKAFTTVVICGNAAGVTLPPYTVYAATTVNKAWSLGEPDHAQYQCSNQGWITENLFID